jgi:hypothetical protein
MNKMKNIFIAIVIISNFLFSCSTLSIYENRRPESVPEKAIWYNEKNRWGYLDEKGKGTF